MEPTHERSIGKRLAAILRHQPELAGLTLDAQGWADVQALLTGLAALGDPITPDELRHVVAHNPKQRFAISEDGRRIRARQGHSVPVELGLEPVTPPDVLLHGTGRGVLEAILQEGLRPMARTHVHLSASPEAAWQVAQRAPGKAVILEVDAGRLSAAGQEFWRTENGVWLTGPVAAEYLSVRSRARPTPTTRR